MENVQVKEEKGKLVISVDLKHDGGLSASGKTTRVASSEGNERIKTTTRGDVFLGLNVYVKPAKE